MLVLKRGALSHELNLAFVSMISDNTSCQTTFKSVLFLCKDTVWLLCIIFYFLRGNKLIFGHICRNSISASSLGGSLPFQQLADI